MFGADIGRRKLRRGARVLKRTARRVAKGVLRRGPARPGQPSDASSIGMVELFEQRQVVGWVEANADRFPIRVTLFINDVEVASTWADDPSQHNTRRMIRSFRFALYDIWQFCHKRDRLTVRIDGRPVPIAAKGTYKRPGKDGKHTLADLKHRFDEGYVFGQTGRLQLSKKLDTVWQDSVFGLYEKVSAIVSSKHGYDAFVIYGSLLGLVREGGFIGHDIDFDAAYLSRCTDGREAATELRDIAFTLIDAGLDVECMRTALHIRDVTDPRIRIDLFHLYFDKNDEIAFPFGVAGNTKMTKHAWAGVTEAQLAGRTVRAPANAAALVEHIYGKNWRTPIAGFNWDRARTGWARDGWSPLEYSEEVYWANFYARTEFTTGSTFFESIVAREDIPRTVLDIGCGDGRDAFAFARGGFRAIGIDRSHIGIRHATQKAADAGLDASLKFEACDVSDVEAMQAVITKARSLADDGRTLFYLRFFLHSIPEAVQDALLASIAEHAREGDVLAAEFRTEEDASNPKVYGKHYRRYQNGRAFGVALAERYGFTVSHEEEGTGLAPYKDEDPVLYRVVATRR